MIFQLLEKITLKKTNKKFSLFFMMADILSVKSEFTNRLNL